MLYNKTLEFMADFPGTTKLNQNAVTHTQFFIAMLTEVSKEILVLYNL